MTTYTEKLELNELEKDKIYLEQYVPNYTPKNIFILPGGGVSATLYVFGVYKALHTAGLLLKQNGDLNTDNVFIGSSGGVIPGLIIINCINLGFTKEPNWFEKYVEASINRITPVIIADMYLATQLRSFMTENLTDSFLDDWSYTHLQSLMERIAPVEMNGKQGVNFLKSDLNDYFKFNYIKVINGNLPYMTDNHKDTVGMTVIEQMKTIFASCCTINGLSYTRFFQNHDAGGLVTNYINCISSYLENKYIRNLFYYTLTSYDNYTYRVINYRNSFDHQERDYKEANYFLIHNVEYECKKLKKNFCLINPPNKFNTIQKFDIPLYNYLQQRIYYESDFSFTERFLCGFVGRNGPDMRKIVSLFGYYETIHLLKDLNNFNKERQKIFQNVDYGYLNELCLIKKGNEYSVVEKDAKDATKMSLFRLTPTEIKQAVNEIQYSNDNKEKEKSMIESCFKEPVVSREESAVILTDYLTLMQGYDPNDYTEKEGKTIEEIKKKYQELYPITTTRQFKKICKTPEKYLNKEYKRVSKDIVNIYMPSFTEKLKNILPFT